MKHVVLLGDSIFDNASYVGAGPDVQDQLAGLLTQPSQVTLLAQDGALIAGAVSQLERLPPPATHLVVSAGGNDALELSGILDEGASSVADCMQMLSAVAGLFGRNYSKMLDAVLKPALPAAVCTIYDPRFREPRRSVAAAALTLLNDRIIREAFARGVAVLDLRLICDHDEDFATEIEPSIRGVAKIAAGIARFVNGAPSSCVIAKP